MTTPSHRRSLHSRPALAALGALAVLAVASAPGAPAAAGGARIGVLATAPAPVAADQPLAFADMSDYVADGGTLTTAHNDVRRFYAVPGQFFEIEIADTFGGHVRFQLLSPSGVDLTNGFAHDFAGTLTEAGEYTLIISDTAYGQDVEYWFSGELRGYSLVSVAAHLDLTGPGRAAALSGELFDPGYEVWSFTAPQLGALADVEWDNIAISYQVYFPDFTLLTDGFSYNGFDFSLPVEGDYYVRLWQNGSPTAVPYTAELSVPPVAAPPAPEPQNAQRLQFQFGDNVARASGTIDSDWDPWIFYGREGQTVFFESFIAPVYWELMTQPGGSIVLSSAALNQRVGVQLPADGDYLLIVNHPSSVGGSFGSGPADYEIEVEIPGLFPDDIPALSSAERFQMARGTHVGDITGTLNGADVDTWVMGVGAGQTVHIEQLGDPVQWRIMFDEGAPYAQGFGSDPAQVYINDKGDYYLQVFTTSQSDTSNYQLRITIPPL